MKKNLVPFISSRKFMLCIRCPATTTTDFFPHSFVLPHPTQPNPTPADRVELKKCAFADCIIEPFRAKSLDYCPVWKNPSLGGPFLLEAVLPHTQSQVPSEYFFLYLYMMIPIHTLTKSSLVTFSFTISIKGGADLRDQLGWNLIRKPSQR